MGGWASAIDHAPGTGNTYYWETSNPSVTTWNRPSDVLSDRVWAVPPENLYLVKPANWEAQIQCYPAACCLSCYGTGFWQPHVDKPKPPPSRRKEHRSEYSDSSFADMNRRLAASPLCAEEDASHWMFVLAPLLLLLMPVLFMYRKPAQHFFAEKVSPCCKNLRSTKQKAPVRHSV